MAHCRLGWTAYGLDPNLRSRPLTRCSLVRSSDELLEKKIDTLLHETFAKRPNDFNSAPSVNDKIVLDKHKDSIKTVNIRYQLVLPFKKENVLVPSNYSYALNKVDHNCKPNPYPNKITAPTCKPDIWTLREDKGSFLYLFIISILFFLS